jgi:hypothetical protein
VTLTFGGHPLDELRQSYAALKESVYNALFLQTRGKEYVDAIGLASDRPVQVFDPDLRPGTRAANAANATPLPRAA